MSIDVANIFKELLAIKNELKNAGMLSHSSSSNSRMKKSQSSGGSRSKQQQQHQQTANGMDVESLRVQPRPLAFVSLLLHIVWFHFVVICVLDNNFCLCVCVCV